jgi:lipopolysaccharide export system protein LptC
MSWRKLLGLALLVAAVATGWLAWNRRDRGEPQAAATERSDYVLRDFEMAMLGKDGIESVRLQAPELQRNREDQSLAIKPGHPAAAVPDARRGRRLAAGGRPGLGQFRRQPGQARR